VLDVSDLARFQIPDSVTVRVFDAAGRAWRGPPVVILAQRWSPLPPLLSGTDGVLAIPCEYFAAADAEQAARRVMEAAKSVPANVRFVLVQAPSRGAARELAQRRAESRWPVGQLESRLYGDMESLIDAYTPAVAADVEDTSGSLDLATSGSVVEIRLRPRRV
jgi:hypothetical protein